MYDNLFLHADPDNKETVPGGYLSDINPNSLTVKQGMADIGVKEVLPEEKFQFIRIGYFCADKDSRPDALVFNRTVKLKEDSGKD